LATPSVIPRSEIPVSAVSTDQHLDIRQFRAHALLGKVMPGSAVSVAWTHVRQDQEVALRSDPKPGLLIIVHGRAELVGAQGRAVEQGDVLAIPAHQAYGFSSVGPSGLQAVHVTFPEPVDARVRTLKQVLARNEARAQMTLTNPFYSLLRDRKLDTPHRRALLIEGARVFADAFQSFLFTRQATCVDESYAPAFLQHLREELGHNELLQVTKDSRACGDPVLKAASAWFCHQMVVLDNVDKAVVNLVLETGGFYLGSLAGPVFEGHEGATFFHTHSEADAAHQEVGAQMLENQTPETYARLADTLDASWNMLDTMTSRIAYIIEMNDTSS
jgi:mannose-6-phosphate isomerase-like protein (cupin superfamily)